MALRSAPAPEGLDHRTRVGLAVGALVLAGECVGAELFLVAIHRPDERQRLGHCLGLDVLRPLEVSPGMRPAQGVGHLRGALRCVGRIRLVTVAEQRGAVLAEKGMNVTVCARRGVVKHHLVAAPVHRPQPPFAHLAFRLAPGLERGLVHCQHPAREHMRTVRFDNRLQQVDGPARPVHQLCAALSRGARVPVQSSLRPARHPPRLAYVALRTPPMPERLLKSCLAREVIRSLFESLPYTFR